MELYGLGLYATDGQDIWLETPIVYPVPTTTERIFGEQVILPLEKPLRHITGQRTLFSDGIIYTYAKANIHPENTSLNKQGERLSMTSFRDAAPSLAASIQSNRDAYEADYDFIVDDVSQYLLSDLASIISLFVVENTLLKIGFFK